MTDEVAGRASQPPKTNAQHSNAFSDAFKGVSFWFGVALGALTIAGVMKHGLAVSLNGFPEVMHRWYVFIFHGAFDLVFWFVDVEVPIWVKDIWSLYVCLATLCSARLQ